MGLHRSRIEWTQYTWNPVTGCRHGCEYCYARRFIARFEPHACERPMEDKDSGAVGILNEQDSPGTYVVCHPVKLADENGKYTRSTSYPKGFAPTLSTYTLDFPRNREIPSRIFVSSMGDLFGSWVPNKWIEAVFDACKQAPQHTYLFLTKNPQRYIDLAKAGKLPTDKNYWYGTTITGPDQPFFFWDDANTFLSIEPLMEPFTLEEMGDENPLERVGWVVVGAMTGPGSKHNEPKREWLEAIVKAAGMAGVPVFMKDSLTDIWGDDLIQDYPEGMPGDFKGHKRPPHCKTCEHATITKQGEKRTLYDCEIGWDAEGCDDRGARRIPGKYVRTSPPWCPVR